MLQVNGKLRGKLTVPADADGKAIEAAARASAEVAKHAAGAPDQARDRRSGKARQCRRLTRAGTSSASRSRPRSRARSPDAAFICAATSRTRSRRSTSTRRPTRPFAAELKRALAGGSTTLVDSAAAAQAILDLSTITDDKQVLSLSGGGRAREYLLTKRADVFAARHRRQGLAAGGRNRRAPLVHLQRVRGARARGRGSKTPEGNADRRRAAGRPPAAGGEEAGVSRAARWRIHGAALESARRAPRAHARAGLRHPRRRAAAGDRGRRRDPCRGAARGIRRARDAGRRARLQVGRLPRRRCQPGSLRRAPARRSRHSVGQARRRGREGARALRVARRSRPDAARHAAEDRPRGAVVGVVHGARGRGGRDRRLSARA